MELKLDDIVDKHKGKVALVVVLGPSLNEHLKHIEELNDNENLIIFTCNMFDVMTNIKTNYWLVCASLQPMLINNSYKRINDHGATFLFAHRIPGFSKEIAKQKIKTNYIPVSDLSNQKDSLQQTFANYTNSETYGPVDTVLLHLINLGVITGCDSIYITGADLNYDKGYVKNGVHTLGERIGKINMNQKAKNRTLDYIKTMKKSANNVGAELFTLNPSSPLSSILEVKTIEDLKNNLNEK